MHSENYMYTQLYQQNLLQIETCSQQAVELKRNLEVVEEKIDVLKAEKIASIEERATKKVLWFDEPFIISSSITNYDATYDCWL